MSPHRFLEMQKAAMEYFSEMERISLVRTELAIEELAALNLFNQVMNADKEVPYERDAFQ